jgi:hypothetical protein
MKCDYIKKLDYELGTTKIELKAYKDLRESLLKQHQINCEKIEKINKLLDEKEKRVVTQIDEEGCSYQHQVELTKTEKHIREVLK